MALKPYSIVFCFGCHFSSFSVNAHGKMSPARPSKTGFATFYLILRGQSYQESAVQDQKATSRAASKRRSLMHPVSLKHGWRASREIQRQQLLRGFTVRAVGVQRISQRQLLARLVQAVELEVGHAEVQMRGRVVGIEAQGFQ